MALSRRLLQHETWQPRFPMLGRKLCVENHVCSLPHAIPCFLRVSSPEMIPFLSSGLPSSCPYAFHTMFFKPLLTSLQKEIHCNKKHYTCKLRYVPIHRSEINMCRANTHFTGYILMPSVISQLSPWPTNRLDVAHHPPSSFFETVYFISITCMCGEDECVHMTECRCLEAADPWNWVTGVCELPDVGAGNRNKSSKSPWLLSCLSSLWPQLLYPCLSQIIPWLTVTRLVFDCLE